MPALIWTPSSKITVRFRHSSEKQALTYLVEQEGHVPVAHNFHCGFAEIDLLTFDPQGVLHIIEVRAWSEGSLLHPLESIDRGKRVRLRRAALAFLARVQDASADARRTLLLTDCAHQLFDPPMSFDLVLVHRDRVEFLQNLL